jgi:hypothetical protein
VTEVRLRNAKQGATTLFCCRVWIILTLLVVSPNSIASAEEEVLPLECSTIPGHIEQLCTVVSVSHDGPYSDVTVYRKPVDGKPVLLYSDQNSVASFAGFGYSKEGRYMWEAWADEGHPYFSFYLTDEYLASGRAAKLLGSLSDYRFERIFEFGDDGKVGYVLNEDAPELCREQGGMSANIISITAGKTGCVKYLLPSNNNQ